ncbi:MAG TPA: 4Fe-4S binding protein [Actinomycetota bacterium]|nr:4Fe-4S binding protein [Actinomycetota bacterium]
MAKVEERAGNGYHGAKLKKERAWTYGIGLLKGMAVTIRHLFSHNVVIEYPDEKQDLSPRTRGVIALKEENCTVCMLCARECPDWCIYIDSHKETLPPKREGGRQRKRNVLDRFAIDYALCMYCGICVEVCPYDALFWSREFEYAEYDIRELTHEKERLSDWMATVLPPPPLEEGALLAGMPEPEMAAPAAAATPTVEATGARPPTTTSSAVEARPEQAEMAPKAGTAAPTDARPAKSLPADEQKEETATVGSTEAPAERPAVMTTEAKETGVPETPAAPTQEEVSETPDSGAEGQVPPTEASAEGASVVSEGPSRTATEAVPAPKAPAEEEAPAPNVTVPHEAPRPVALERTEDPDAVYREVLDEQIAKGSSKQVAEARAKVARVKAERGIRRGPTPIHTEKMVPSAPTKGQPAEAEPSGAPDAQEPKPPQGPVAPTEGEGS